MGMGTGTEYTTLSPSGPEDTYDTHTTRSTSNLGVWARRDAKPYRRHAVLGPLWVRGFLLCIYLPVAYLQVTSSEHVRYLGMRWWMASAPLFRRFHSIVSGLVRHGGF